ncbi:hypothetical protein B0T14DRAFT_255149 [Immersiella caudata]|uniref:DUF6594 domain-containing protein n=1 Tax=Immersiella caudata TaxID=314043 RepID=A0AA39WKB2_9PEZI|nr:hypothetical protein B0T14DRAFT_255149 [Immersiella caudata]
MSLPTYHKTSDRSMASGSSPPPSESPHSVVSSWGGTRQTSLSDSPLLPSPTSPVSPTRSTATTAVTIPESGDPAPLGWPSLAKAMAETPGYESFCRFRELNVKNLLYLQVEIAGLEEELKRIESEDKASREVPRMSYARCADRMLKSGNEKEEGSLGRKQCDTVWKIRDLLEKYNNALLAHASVSALPSPEDSDVYRLWTGLKRGKIAGGLGIHGKGSRIWGDINTPSPKAAPEEGSTGSSAFLGFFRRVIAASSKNTDDNASQPQCCAGLDLVTVHPSPETDKFTRWVVHSWIPFYHKVFRSHTVNSTDDPNYMTPKEYSKSKIGRFTAFVTTVVACLLPTVAIVVLSTAKTRGQIFGYIAGFTALFAMGLMWLTDASSKRVQIFTATAAFSAVLVVFVQNQ